MFLRKSSVTSGASRNVQKLTSNWLNKTRFNYLTWRRKSLAGRGSTGRIILKSKGSILSKLRYPFINYNFRFKNITLVSTFYLIPFQNKLVSLCFLSTGGVTYLQSTTSFNLFSFLTTPFFSAKSSKKEFIKPTFGLLVRVKLLTKISLLELYPGSGVQYARSSGTSAKFIKTDLKNHTALIRLPSGVRKSFSLYSFVSIGAVSLKIKRLVNNTRAGYWRKYGFKARTRGVAMNPVDHPHGGRTKAIKNQRTPWGKPTKLK